MRLIVIVFSIVELLSSPLLMTQTQYRTTWLKDGLIVGGGAIVALGTSFVNDTIGVFNEQEIDHLSKENINWFDRSATNNYSEDLANGSDILVGLTMAAPFTLLLDDKIRNDGKSIGVMYLETALFATIVPEFIKNSTKRIRPFVYNPLVPMEKKISFDAQRSFFSGHTTWAFSSAVFHSRWKPYVWAGSLLTASAVGFLRYQSGAHFPTDILAGAMVGFVIGYVIPCLHKADNKSENIFSNQQSYQLHFAVKF
ncbi:MAG: phosphatase PAP2 family protein [Ignavibacteriales bacterium]|nr:phosphatase PAP2 family protein [Ignavibacteriales bacterium]